MDKKGKKLESSVLINMIMYLLFIILGTFVMVYPEIGILKPILYISIIYYILTFFTCLFYFIGRRKGDFENIILCLINVMIASYLFLMQDKTTNDVLGLAVSIYTILVIFNKMYSAHRLRTTNNIMWGMKYLISLLLAFLGMLTIFNLFNEVSVVTLMFGYYFIVFGLINFMEYLVEALMEFSGVRIFLEYIEDAKVKRNPKKTEVKDESIKEVEVKKEIEPKKEVKAKTEVKKEVKPEKEVKVKTEVKKEVKPKQVIKEETQVKPVVKKQEVKVAKSKPVKKVEKKVVKKPTKKVAATKKTVKKQVTKKGKNTKK